MPFTITKIWHARKCLFPHLELSKHCKIQKMDWTLPWPILDINYLDPPLFKNASLIVAELLLKKIALHQILSSPCETDHLQTIFISV